MTIKPGHSEKVIFLDFDGPMSSHRMALAEGQFNGFDPVSARVLSHICQVSGAKIVCVSVRTWFGSRDSFLETKKLFAESGLDPAHMHVDWSARDRRSHSRLQHIKTFLAEHPEITHYAIIDDEGENEEYLTHPCLIHVRHENGIMYEDFQKIAELLEIDEGLIWDEARRASRTQPLYQLRLCLEFYDAQINDSIMNADRADLDLAP
jgi:hypothetical protein